MELKYVHPSHKMKWNEYNGRHEDYTCTVCDYYTSVCCPEDPCGDDDELKAECIGFSWYNGVWDGDKLIGRKSGTGWPKLPKRTTQTN